MTVVTALEMLVVTPEEAVVELPFPDWDGGEWSEMIRSRGAP